MIRIQVPVSHPVVQQHPRITRDQTRTVPHLDALQLPDRITPSIHHTEVRCV